MIAWKLTTEFNKTQHLFSKKVYIDYLVNTFTCSCGHVDFVLSHLYDEIEYTCPMCENRTFYDANLLWKNIDLFITQYEDIKITGEYNISTCKEKVEAKYILTAPMKIDFLRKRVYYDKKSIYSLSLLKDGEIEEKYEIEKDTEIFTQLNKDLVTQLNLTPEYFDLPDSNGKLYYLHNIQFFLKNPHLKDIDFYSWTEVEELPKKTMTIEKALRFVSNHRQEKSVKKAVYRNYRYQLNTYLKFSPSLIEVFTKKIKDPNILCQLLQLYIYDKNIDSHLLSEFLTSVQKVYSNKQILSLFEELSKNFVSSQFFSDMMRGVVGIDGFFEEHKKVKCTIKSLHDTSAQYRRNNSTNILIDKKIFNTKNKLKPCVTIDSYYIQLPQNGAELLVWADTLHNCMDAYLDMILNDETIIYGFFIENKIDFAVEIHDGEIIQASRVCNQELLSCQQDVLKKWLKRYFPKESLDYVA